MTVTETAKFVHNGFECSIYERPDLCCMYQVYGRHKESSEVFFPNRVLFKKEIGFDEIKRVAISIMDGTFDGEGIEIYGSYTVYAGNKSQRGI